MTLCDFTSNYGEPPSGCPELQQYLQVLLNIVRTKEYLKHSTGTLPPTTYQLDQLWAPCDAPSNAVVVWHDTVAGTISQWVKAGADTAWLEFTNTAYAPAFP
jgi:hypothetical protein